MVLCSTPLVAHPCRDAILSLLYQNNPTKMEFFTVTTIEVFTSLCLALITPNIGYVINVLGSIFFPILGSILPCLFYIRAFPGKIIRYDLFLAFLVIIFISFIGLMGFLLFWTRLFRVIT